MIYLLTFIIGFLLGKIKFKIPTRNKITIMKKNLNNRLWLEDMYEKLMDKEKDNEHYYDFKCSVAFVGQITAEHNKKKYYNKKKRLERKRNFISKFLKYNSPTYYKKYIGEISEQEMKIIKRDRTLNELLKK